MRLALITSVWRRPHLTKGMLRYYQRMQAALASEGIQLTNAAVGSEGDASRAMCEDAGFLYTEAPNRPLGAKLNAVVASLEGHEFDGMVMFGSDDWLSHDVIRGHARLLADGVDYARVNGLYIIDAATKGCVYCTGHTGVGALLRRHLVADLGWELWPKNANGRLDTWLMKKLYGKPKRFWRNPLSALDPGAIIIDVKTRTNLRGYTKIANQTRFSRPCDLGDVLQHFAEQDRHELLEAMRLQHEADLASRGHAG